MIHPTKSQSIMMSRLEPIADILQMRLFYHEVHGAARIHGNLKLESLVTGDVGLTLDCKVHAGWYMGHDQAHLLIHIKGDLWVYVRHYYETHTIFFTVLNGTKVGLNTTSASLFVGKSHDKILSMFKDGTVGEWVMDMSMHNKREWRKIDVETTGVVAGLDGAPEQVGAGTDQANGSTLPHS